MRLLPIPIRRYMQSPPSVVSAVAIGALAFILACTSHEVMGHATACIAEGGRITLLTSVYFKCAGSGVVTDLAGPLANLVLALGAWLLLKEHRSPDVRLMLALTLAFNLFWLSGCMLTSAATGTSDFAYPLRVLAVSPAWLARVVLGTVGLAVYWVGIRTTAKFLHGAPIVASYLSAGIVSCTAALCFVGFVPGALRAAALESFGAMAGLLVAASRRSSQSPPSSPSGHYKWLLASALAIVAFALSLGRGLVVSANA